MAPVLPFALLGMFSSITPAFGIKTKLPDASGLSEGVESVHETGESTSGSDFYEANCRDLRLLGGIPVGGSLKVTVNGWQDDSRDFETTLVTDHSKQLAKLNSEEHEAKDGSEELEERPSEPIVGVRISSGGDSEKQSAVLLYGGSGAAPKELPLESPAGPTRSFMIILTQASTSSMIVDVLTWISGGEGGADAGKWDKVSKTIEVKQRPNTDLKYNVDVNGCGAKVMKLYASPDTRAVTVQDGMCSSTEQPLVELSSRKHPVVSR